MEIILVYTSFLVRVFDFIANVMSDFEQARLRLLNTRMEGHLRKQSVKFQDGFQGPDKLIKIPTHPF